MSQQEEHSDFEDSSGAQQRLGPIRESLLGWCGRVVLAAPLAIIIIAFVLAIVGALLATYDLRLDADTNSLINKNRPFMKTYTAFMEEFGDLEYIYIVVDAGSPPDTDAAEKAVHELVDQLSSDTDLPDVYGFITPNEAWRIAPRAMKIDQLQGLVDASSGFGPILANDSPGEILELADQTLVKLITTGLSLDEDTAKRLGAQALFQLEAIAATPAKPDGALSDFELAYPRPYEYLKSTTGRMYFIEVLPHKDFGSLAVIKKPLEQIRGAISAVQAKHPQIAIGLTGKPVLQADELATTQVDMTRASILALTVISILFMIVFRGIKRPLLAVIAFAAAFGWTYGSAAILVGRLNLLSMVFMLVLVGVGLDYGVHVVARWREARRQTRAPGAVRHVMKTAVVGNLTGAATSAGVFLLALLTNFQGLRELGVIAGVGLLLCVLTMTLVLPALLVLTERNKGPEGGVPVRTAVGQHTSDSTRRAGPAGYLMLILAAVATVFFIFVVPEKLQYESNLLKLQAKGVESVEWEHRLFEDDSSASWFAAIIVDSIEEIPAVVKKAKQHPEIGRILSILDIMALPTPQREALRKALSEAAVPGEPSRSGPEALDPALVRRTVGRLGTLATLASGSATDEEVARMRSIAARLDAQRQVLRNDDSVAAINLQTDIDAAVANTANALRQMALSDKLTLRETLPTAVRARFMSPKGRFLVLLQPANNVWEYEPMKEFVTAIREVDPNATGVPVTQFESMNDMMHSFTIMAIGAILVVGLAIWLDFRSILAMLLCMTSLAIGILWTLGVLAIASIPINLANFFGIPILIGVGAASSIHMVHRWQLMQKTGEQSYGAAMKAIILTACTTGIGFGALIFARHRGLESLGWVMAIGSIACLLSAIVLLPVVLELLPERIKIRLRAR